MFPVRAYVSTLTGIHSLPQENTSYVLSCRRYPAPVACHCGLVRISTLVAFCWLTIQVVSLVNWLSTAPWKHVEEWRYSSSKFDFGVRQVWSVSRSRDFNSGEKSPRYSSYMRLGGPQSRSGPCGIETNTYRKSNVGVPPRSPSLCRLSSPGPSKCSYMEHILKPSSVSKLLQTGGLRNIC
jgi:hypothetical protein